MTHSGIQNRFRRHLTSLLIASGAFLLTLARPDFAQTVQPRQVAAVSSDPSFQSAPVNETAIAAGSDRVMCVYHVGSAPEIGYSLASLSGGAWSWTEGLIDASNPTFTTFTDPSVALDGITGDFLVCALTLDRTRLVMARWIRANGQFGTWQQIGPTSILYDKTWVVAGHMIQGEAPQAFREFYLTFEQDGYLGYHHTINGGDTWTTSCGETGAFYALTNLTDCNSRIPMSSWPVPRVYQNRPLYVAYLSTTGISIVRGTDITSGPDNREVRFTPLSFIDSASQPTTIPGPNVPGANLYTYVPPFNAISGPRGYGIDLAVDPTNANRMYLVTHDTATNNPNDKDVNIYLRVLTRVASPPDTWQVGDRILVADDSLPLEETDQFMPSVDVDASGRIHIIYYSDQDFDQDDGDFYVQHDVYYAWSSNQGSTWNYQELCDDPPNCGTTVPAVDYNLPSALVLRDYIGIDVGSGQVWTSFMGQAPHPRDPFADKSVIWSNRIVLP